MTTRIRTRRVDSNTVAVIRTNDDTARTYVAGWVHNGPDHTFVGQLALGSNPARNQRIFTDMAEAVDWVYEGRPNTGVYCGRCGVQMTAADPAVTVLGPRCRGCWTS